MTIVDPGPLLIFGCGYTGLRVARLWRQTGQPVYALTRQRAAFLAEQGIIPLLGDIVQPQQLPSLPAAPFVLYAVGYDRSSGRSMREIYLDGLVHIVQRLSRPCRFVYVSSTSVYGQTDGSWVDEDSPTEPIDEGGHIVRHAESLLRQHLPGAIVLRSAGIYGPGRLLRRREQLCQGEAIPGDPERWLNLIYVDDLAQAICLGLHQAPEGSLYNIVDDQPVTRRYYYTRLAELYHAPAPRFSSQAEQRSHHRRIRNQRACMQLGWRPQYPSIDVGLPAAITAETT